MWIAIIMAVTFLVVMTFTICGWWNFTELDQTEDYYYDDSGGGDDDAGSIRSPRRSTAWAIAGRCLLLGLPLLQMTLWYVESQSVVNGVLGGWQTVQGVVCLSLSFLSGGAMLLALIRTHCTNPGVIPLQWWQWNGDMTQPPQTPPHARTLQIDWRRRRDDTTISAGSSSSSSSSRKRQLLAIETIELLENPTAQEIAAARKYATFESLAATLDGDDVEIDMPSSSSSSKLSAPLMDDDVRSRHQASSTSSSSPPAASSASASSISASSATAAAAATAREFIRVTTAVTEVVRQTAPHVVVTPTMSSYVISQPIRFSYCIPCSTFKPPRSQHCRQCARCISQQDHHCLWLDQCIGQHNHHHYLKVLIYMALTYLWHLILLSLLLLPSSSPSSSSSSSSSSPSSSSSSPSSPSWSAGDLSSESLHAVLFWFTTLLTPVLLLLVVLQLRLQLGLIASAMTWSEYVTTATSSSASASSALSSSSSSMEDNDSNDDNHSSSSSSSSIRVHRTLAAIVGVNRHHHHASPYSRGSVGRNLRYFYDGYRSARASARR
jgi:hypothetical protein